MTDASCPSSPFTRRDDWWSPRRPWFWMLTLACLSLVAFPGCSGCRKNSAAAKKKAEEEAEAEKKKKKKLPDYEVTQLTSYPDDPDQVQNFVKPGHWVTMTEQMRANNFDFQAEFELAATDSDGRPFLVEDTDFHLRLNRPVSLPKGQARVVELTTYVPRVPRTAANTETKRVWFEGRLLAARGGKQVSESREATTEMLDHEFFLVVLAKEPNNFRFLKVLDAIAPPAHGEDGGRKYHYRVVMPPTSEFIPLPSHPLTWTSIAYLFWDEIDPNGLSTEQQQALLDWLHWGGQLIINGPGSLDLLKNSFLNPYLPADNGGNVDLDMEQLRPLDEFWSIPSRVKSPDANSPDAKTADSRRIVLKNNRPLLGIQLRPRDTASWVANSGQLVSERRVGGGRVVVTAFPMDDESIRDWKSFDNFLNGCLLRRPARDFRPLANLDDDNAQPIWSGFDSGLAADARLMSTLRFLTRDVGLLQTGTLSSGTLSSGTLSSGAMSTGATSGDESTGDESTGEDDASPEGATTSRANRDERELPPRAIAPRGPTTNASSPMDGRSEAGSAAPRDSIYSDMDDYRFRGASTDRLSGVAGWNDDSGASVAVLDTIREAAGITIPEASFVLKMVAIYLIVLVPVNWGFFRLIGKVEWAWIAVPILAIIGAVVVIRMAQLDIGFVRSRREVAILELQGGYDRGHLTRYTLLYSSLSTNYDVTFNDPSAVAQPFSKGVAPQTGMYASSRSVSFRRDDQVRLSDFLVNSNSTELLHSEQMMPLNGAMELEGSDEEGWELHNHGDLTLADVGILRRVADPTREVYEQAWVASLAPRGQVELKFEPCARPNVPWVRQWDDAKVWNPRLTRDKGEMNLGRFAQLAVQKMKLGPGDVRLVGWTGEDLAGVAFEPGAAQTSTRAVVVCHLRRGALPEVARDENVRTDFFAPKPLDEEGEAANSGPTTDGAPALTPP